MKYSLLALVFAFMVSCSSSDSEKDYRVENDEEIAAYVAANSLSATKTASGLYYVVEEEGTGISITNTSNVAVSYKGYFTNGSVFDDSKGDMVSFNLQGVIPGWTEGLTYFKEGGKGMLLVPAHLGYGSKDRNGVPGGSVLIFEITVFSPEMIREKNDVKISAYVEKEGLDVTKTESGLYYVMDKEGTGEQPTETSKVQVSYKGYYLNGATFDESSVSGVELDLAKVIKGWKEGMTYFKVGGEGKLIIPAHLGYGSYPYQGIPGGSILVFDVKLIAINE